MFVPNLRLKLIKTAPSSCALSLLEYPSIDKETVQPDNTSYQNDETNELIIFKITIPSLSLIPLTGKEVVDRVYNKAREVFSRYLPRVEFLVARQQDLGAGLVKRHLNVGWSQHSSSENF